MICPCDFTPIPMGARVVLLADGATGTITGWDHPGFAPRAETIRYHVDRDDGTWVFAAHDVLAPPLGRSGPRLRC